MRISRTCRVGRHHMWTRGSTNSISVFKRSSSRAHAVREGTCPSTAVQCRAKLFSRTHHTENQKLLHTFTTPNALLSLILKMLGRMPTYCMPVAYPLPACHPPTPPATNRMLYHIYTVIYLMLGGVHLCLEANATC